MLSFICCAHSSTVSMACIFLIFHCWIFHDPSILFRGCNAVSIPKLPESETHLSLLGSLQLLLKQASEMQAAHLVEVQSNFVEFKLTTECNDDPKLNEHPVNKALRAEKDCKNVSTPLLISFATK